MNRTAAKDIAIRALKPSEWDSLASLWVESWRATLPDIDFESRRGWLRDRLDSLHCTGAITLCAHDEAGKALLGFVTIDPQSGWLDQLAVAPQSFGRGVGGALMGAAKSLSAARIELDVNQDNARALRFYRAHDFTITEAAQNPFSGLPTWRMEWRAGLQLASRG